MAVAESPAARSVFEAQLARTYERALRARAEVEAMAGLATNARGRLDRLAPAAPPAPIATSLPMERLARRFGLAADHLELVWSIVACSVDARLVPHLEALGGAHARRGLSLAVYALLAELDGAAASRLAHWLASPNPLVGDGLLVATEPASPAARAYVASPRLVSYLLDEEPPTEPVRVARVPADLLYDPPQLQALAEIAHVLERDERAVLVVEGPIGSGRLTACARAACRTLVAIDLARIGASELAGALAALRCEGALRDALVALANVDHVLGEEQRDARQVIGGFLDGVAGAVVLTSTVRGLDLGTTRPLVRVAWDVAETSVRAALWRQALAARGGDVDGDLLVLAHRYRVGPGAIERAVASVQLVHAGGARLTEADLILGLRHNIAEGLGGLAQRVEVTQTWDDLVVTEDVLDLIAALIGRVRHAQQVLGTWGYRQKIARGAGVASLFSGPPGTGKTMVAGLIARELDLELYQVDLSKVVSKWVGETEKNLARVFDAAEEGHGLLLFDEADALFGQRTADMRGANDRYANLEVNFLLQRIEAFGGITILTTNLETAIDSALKRRLAAHVVFAAPDEDERAVLWQRQTTTGSAPIAGDVDARELAHAFPKMTGANIRNAAISAAFLAAADGSPAITRDHLLRAARAEYRSMGYIITEGISARSL